MPSTTERAAALAAIVEEAELRGLSPSTASAYRGYCSQYLEWLGDRPLAGTGEEDVRGWALHLGRERGLAARTINAHVAAAALMHEALGRPLDRSRVPFRKVPRTLPQVLSRDEVAALMRAAANRRHLALFALGYGCGLRVSL